MDFLKPSSREKLMSLPPIASFQVFPLPFVKCFLYTITCYMLAYLILSATYKVDVILPLLQTNKKKLRVTNFSNTTQLIIRANLLLCSPVPSHSHISTLNYQHCLIQQNHRFLRSQVKQVINSTIATTTKN